eukprot:IDg5136t1
MSCTGVFRKVFLVIHAVIQNAGGYEAILSFQLNEQNSHRAFSSFIDSEALRLYTSSTLPNTRIVCINVYADSTKFARFRSQSTTPIRLQVCNVRGQSAKWHEVGTAPLIPNQTSYMERKMDTNASCFSIGTHIYFCVMPYLLPRQDS